MGLSTSEVVGAKGAPISRFHTKREFQQTGFTDPGGLHNHGALEYLSPPPTRDVPNTFRTRGKAIFWRHTLGDESRGLHFRTYPRRDAYNRSRSPPRGVPSGDPAPCIKGGFPARLWGYQKTSVGENHSGAPLTFAAGGP